MAATGYNVITTADTISFRDGTTGLASISFDHATETLSLTQEGTGAISFGDTASDLYIGDGVNSVDLIFEVDGAVKGDTDVTLTLGATDSDILIASPVATLTGSQIATESWVLGQVVDSAPATLNTLNELAAALGDDANYSTTISTALGNRLRVDTASQGLSSTEKGYGRTNLGLGSASTSDSSEFASASSLTSHTGNTSNPHSVTKAQVGLSNVANTLITVTSSSVSDGTNTFNKYTLPTATNTVKGGIELASNTVQTTAVGSITSTANRTYGLQLNSNGQGCINVPWTDTVYSLPLAASGTRGGVQIGYAENGKNYPVELSSEKMFVNVPWTDTNTTYSLATSSTAGIVKIGFTESGKNYPVELSNEQMFVNVPWTDNNTTYSTATSSTLGLVKIGYTTSSKNYAVQLSNEQMFVNVPWTDTVYSLPLAASGTRGGVQIGYAENGKNYPVELSSEKMFVNVPWTDTNTTYSTATSSSLGLVKIGFTASGKNYPVQLSNEQMFVNVPWTDTDTNTTYSTATSSTAGLVKIGYTTSSQNYAVQLSNEQMFVNVPWTDNNTTYSAGTGISLSGTTFSLSDTNAKLNKGGDTMTGDLVTTSGNANGIYIGASSGANITSVTPSSRDVVIQRLEQLRFGNESSWDWNAWAGIKFDGSNEILYIGGPAASQFQSNANPPTIDVDFVGVGSVKLGGSALATQSYVTTAVANVIDSAPAALDTLNELAAALGDDANFSTTMSTALGNRLRVDTASQGLSSTEQGYGRTNLGLGTAATYSSGSFATSAQGTTADNALPKAGGTMTGDITMGANQLTFTSLTAPQIIGERGTTDLNSRFFTDEGGFSYTTFDAGTSNKPSNVSNNANAVITMNSHTGGYGHQLAFTSGNYLYRRMNSNGTIGSWIQIWDSSKHPTTLSGYGITDAATSAQGTKADTAYGWGNHASANYLTANQTITLSGDVSGSGTTSISVSLAADSVGSAEIADNAVTAAAIAANAVGASELNVTGNGTTAQFLRSDGDGTFTWATPTDTNTTYSVGSGLESNGTVFSLGLATSSVRGGAKIGYTQNAKNYPVQLSNEQMFVNVPWTDNNTTYSTATSSTAGLVKIGYTTASQNYAVQLSNEQMFVNVPWTDNNTTYSAGSLLDLSGTTFNVDLSELADMTQTIVGTDEFVVLDASSQKRKAASEIPLSIFNNDLPSVTNTNYYLDGISKSGNTLTFSVNGATNQAYTFGSNAFTSTTIPTSLTSFGVSASSSELNVLDGITATTTELNYTDGVTSNIQTQLDSKLSTSGTAANANTLDGIDSTGFLRSNVADSLTNVLTVDDANGGTIVYNLASNGVYIPKPQGADYVTTSSTHTGAIGIKLPTTSWGAADMISFHVDIYDYNGGVQGESVTLHIFGYQYNTSNAWVNVGATVLSDRTDRDYTVRFGNDGTRAIVWIGETNSEFNYNQIIVRDFSAGYNAYEANWDTGWDIVVNVTSFDTVNQTSPANYPVAKQLKTARNIALTGAVTGNANFDGSGNISIATTATADPTLTLAGDASGSATFTNLGNATLTVTVADDSHNHIISNIDGLQTALDAKQASGTYNTIIGTDTDISYSGATVLSAMTMTDGVIQSHSSRTLTLADLGYTGATNANNYSLPVATSSVRGGVKIGYTANSQNYPVQLSSTEQMYVNVPWTDTNTTYTLASFGVSASSTELNRLDGITATTTELNYTDGVTSNIQTQLNGKAASSHTHTFASLTSKPTTLSGYGITDAASSSHTHALGDLSGVTISSVGSNEVLSYNGAGWVNRTLAEAGIQPAGTYNTIIGTDSDINTSGSTIIDNIYVTDGVITSMGTRTLTAANIGALTQSDFEELLWQNTGRIYSPMNQPLRYSSSGTTGELQGVCYTRAEVTSTGNAWAQNCLTRSFTNEISWSGGGPEFARKLGASFKCSFVASGTQAQSIRFMFGGRANNVQAAGNNPLVYRGFGAEFRSRSGTTIEWRVIAHNGTSFSASSWTDIPSNTTGNYTKELYIYSDGAGNITAGLDDRGGDGSSWTTKTTTGGPTANGNSTYPYLVNEVINASSGSSYARSRIYDYKIFSE